MNRHHLSTILLLAAAACGDVSRKLPDGPTTIDASNIDAAPAVIRVTTMSPQGYSAPQAGVAVVFSAPGGMTTTVASDLDGKASAEVPAHTNVSAVWVLDSNSVSVETILDASPGDELVFSGAGVDNTPVGVYNVSWPAAAGAAHYDVSLGSCGVQSFAAVTSGAIPVSTYCLPTDKVTISVVALDASYNFIGYLEQPNVSYVSGGTTNLGGGYATEQTFAAQLTNTDPTLESYLAVYRNPSNAFSTSSGTSVTTTSTPLSMPAPLSGSAVVMTQVNAVQCCGYQSLFQKINGSSLQYNLDVGANLAPWLGTPTMDVPNHALTVPTTGPGSMKIGIALLNVTKTINGTQHYIDWTVITPSFANALTLPAIPMTIADVMPAGSDQFYANEVLLIDSTDIPSYAVARNALGSFTRDPGAGLGTNVLRISYYQFD